MTTSTDDDPFEKAHDTDGRAVGRRGAARLGPRDGHASSPPAGAQASCGCAAPKCSPATPMRSRRPRSSPGAAGSARATWRPSTAEGWVRIVGRLKDVIIRGGENISASEVEAALEAHPDIHHAVAVGYPDPLMGERVAAFVESAAPVRPRGVPALVRRPGHGEVQDAREGRAPRPPAAAGLGQARPGRLAAPARRHLSRHPSRGSHDRGAPGPGSFGPCPAAI